MTTNRPAAALQVARSRRLGLAAAAAAAALVALVAWWFVTHPPALPVTDDRVTASVPTGQSLYLGVFTLPQDSERELRVDGVKVTASSTAPVTLRPWLCDGGAPVVTTDPTAFCGELLATEGGRLGPGDSVVLEVLGEEEAVVGIDRVRVGYRDGLQAATHEAGAPAMVTVRGR